MTIKFNVLLFLFLFTLGCLPTQESGVNSSISGYDGGLSPFCPDRTTSAPFEVGQITAKVTPLEIEGTLPSQFTLTFTACMNDKRYVQREKLTTGSYGVCTYQRYTETNQPNISKCSLVGDPSQTEYKAFILSPLANGCFKWQEEYDYIRPLQNKWIYFERVIFNNTGQVTVGMVVNPWEEQPQNVIYNLQQESAPVAPEKIYRMYEDESLAEASDVEKCAMSRSLEKVLDHLTQEEQSAILHSEMIKTSVNFHTAQVDGVDYVSGGFSIQYESSEGVKEEPRGVFMDLELRIPLYMKFENYRGIVGDDPVEKGYFQVTPMLVAQLDNKSYRLHRAIQPKPKRKSSAQDLAVSFQKIHIPRGLPTARLTLYLKVEALTNDGKLDKNIKPFYRAYALGTKSVSQLTGNQDFQAQSLEEKDNEVTDLNLNNKTLTADMRVAIKENNIFKKRFEDLLFAEDGQDRFYKDLEETRNFSRAIGLELDLERMRFFKVFNNPDKEICESVVKRKVLYQGKVSLETYDGRKLDISRVKICVENVKFDSKTGMIQDSTVNKSQSSYCEDSSEDVKIITNKYDLTEDSGDMYFSYVLSHDIYDTQEFFIRKFTFETDGFAPRSRVFVFNPWEFGFLTYQDVTPAFDKYKRMQEFCTEKHKESKKIGECIEEESRTDRHDDDGVVVNFRTIVERAGVHPPTLRLNEFRSVLIEPSYTIRNSLDIGTVKNSMVLLRPTIARFDGFGRTIRAASMPIPRGYWILRMILVKGPQETKEAQTNIISSELEYPLETPFSQISKLLGFGQSDYFKSHIDRAREEANLRGQTEFLDEDSDLPLSPDRLQSIGEAMKKESFDLVQPTLNVQKTYWEELLRLITAGEDFQNEDIQYVFKQLGLTERQIRDFKTKFVDENKGTVFFEYDKIKQWFEEKVDIYLNAINFDKHSINPKCRGFNPNCGKSYDRDDYIDHVDTLAYSENGVISAFVNFEFNVEHFRYLGSKNGIIIQLYPTDPELYQYHKGSCTLDIENSTFKPYAGHDLITQPHWGVSSSGYGYTNIVRPIGETLLENFVKRKGAPDAPMKPIFGTEDIDGLTIKLNRGGEDLTNLINLKKELQQIDSEVEKTNLNATPVYDSIETQARGIEQVAANKEMLKNYCKEEEDQEDSYVKSCICLKSENVDSEKIPTVIKECIAANKVSSGHEKSFFNEYHKEVTSSISSQDVLNDFAKKQYCASIKRDSATALSGRGNEDISEDGFGYKQCVCEDDSTDSLTMVMAKCFSKNQGLTVVDIADGHFKEKFDQSFTVFKDEMKWLSQFGNGGREIKKVVKGIKSFFGVATDEPVEPDFHYMSYKETFSGDRNTIQKNVQELSDISNSTNIDTEDIQGFIRKGFSEGNIKNGKQGVFLHAMCNFWFDKYYDNFLDTDNILSFYEYHNRNYSVIKQQQMISKNSEEDNWFQFELRDGLDGLSFKNKDNLKELQKNPFAARPFEVLIDPSKAYTNGGSASFIPTNWSHPYLRCLKNPKLFFHLERKVMVEEISDRNEDFVYHGGLVYNYTQVARRGASIRKGWGLRDSLSIGTDVKAGIGVLSFAGAYKKELSLTDDTSIYNDSGFTNAIILAVNHIKTQLGFKKYRQCLMIRPRVAAFKGYGDPMWGTNFKEQVSASVTTDTSQKKDATEFMKFVYKSFGLLLCDDDVDASSDASLVKRVDEDYYYIHQFFGGHYEFMSRAIYHNRPFVQILRGKASMDKFEMLTQSEDYKVWRTERPSAFNHKPLEVAEHLKEAFDETTLDWAGFVEGIYTYPDSYHHYFFEDQGDKEPSLVDKALEKLGEITPFTSRDTD